jgi:hypothetical protein
MAVVVQAQRTLVEVVKVLEVLLVLAVAQELLLLDTHLLKQLAEQLLKLQLIGFTHLQVQEHLLQLRL